MADELKKNRQLRTWLLIVIVVAVALRVLLFAVYPPVSYSDTASYRRSANAVLGGFEKYDGTRTPGYPVFMALVGPDRAVYAVQLVLGLGITLAWFLIAWQATKSPVFAGIAALAHTLNPGQLFFEADLLTETLATFWLMLALLGAWFWLRAEKNRTIWLGLAIGLAASFAVLTRPVFIFMPVWLAVFLAVSFKERKLKVDWRAVWTILLVTAVVVGGWMSYIKSRYHVFSVSTMSGYHLVQHTGYYFEDVPDEYAVIRDIYLEYRDARITERGTQGNTIWDAIPAIMDATGLSFYDLSQVMSKISVQLILTHPWQYLARVLRGWWLFWRAPVYWDVTSVQSAVLAKGLNGLIIVVRLTLFAGNLVFVGTSALALVSRKLREMWQLQPFHWLLAGSIWATSVVSSLLDHGDNPRFLIPLQTAVVFWVLWIIFFTWQNWRSAKQSAQN
ncbi:MAG: glycosyltransferase family 39 protein, partial [Anaerolineaceae bacterium]|nr:glycosyltransferase family 39 protein [Anaerolineaceae bacterium]